MLHKTRGIVFRYIKFRESSIIATIFTEEMGIQSYIINGIRSARSKKSLIDFAPLSLLDLVVYQKENRDIQRISDWKRIQHLSHIHTDLKKSCIVIFLSEVLYKSLKESEASKDLFEFIFHSIEWLEESHSSVANFHIQFLTKLARYLGFGLDNYILDPQIEKLFKLSTLSYGGEWKMDRMERSEALESLILYYREHIEGFGQIKSLSILQEVFDD